MLSTFALAGRSTDRLTLIWTTFPFNTRTHRQWYSWAKRNFSFTVYRCKFCLRYEALGILRRCPIWVADHLFAVLDVVKYGPILYPRTTKDQLQAVMKNGVNPYEPSSENFRKSGGPKHWTSVTEVLCLQFVSQAEQGQHKFKWTLGRWTSDLFLK